MLLQCPHFLGRCYAYAKANLLGAAVQNFVTESSIKTARKNMFSVLLFSFFYFYLDLRSVFIPKSISYAVCVAIFDGDSTNTR